MFAYYTPLKNKFNRVFNKIVIDKPFLAESKDFWQSHFISSVTNDYLAYKFNLVKGDPGLSYNKKLRRIFSIDDFSDEKLFQDISRIRLRFLVSILSVLHDEDDLKFLLDKFLTTKRELETLKRFSSMPLDEKSVLIKNIIKAKNDLINETKKVSQRQVAEKLGLRYSTFRDKLDHYKIKFDNIK